MGLLNNEQRKDKINFEIQKYITENDNEMVEPTMVWDALKAVMRGRLISEATYAKKMKLKTYRNIEKLRVLERDYQHSADFETQKKIKLVVKLEIDKHLTGEIERKLLFYKQSYYEIGPRATKLLARRTRKQLTTSQIHKIRDPLLNQLITEPEETERTFQRYYEELYTQPESAQRAEIKSLLNTLDLPKIGQRQNDTLTRDISIEEVVNRLKNAKAA